MHKESGHTALDEMRSQWRLMTVYERFEQVVDERFEQVVAITLSGVIALVIVISLIQLIRLVFTLLVMDALNPLDHKVFQLVFGATMTLLIAMEFKHSIVKVALRKESIIQVKTVILIAILALARKFIILEPDVDPAKVAALAGTVLALGLTYWLMRERDDRKSE
ncbi:MAG: diguanylate cyclase [Ectopseudomonas oleovorans]|nr:MAG: diguanylate cyclase [Pseudomonas oleovorans]